MRLHFDEARAMADEAISGWLRHDTRVKRILLVADLFGKLRLIVWGDPHIDVDKLDQELTAKVDTWWSGEILVIDDADAGAQRPYEAAWDEAQQSATDERYARLDRHRHRTSWFNESANPLWKAPDHGAPVIVFYSFKGGFGRTTALSSFAIQRARAGERVCVVDFDLDSPGVGLLLNHDGQGGTAAWGVVDFLLEHTAADFSLSDYYHRCDRIADRGEVVVVPAGSVNRFYVDKLARIDFEDTLAAVHGGVAALLQRIRTELSPNWILLDSRTGVSDSAGLLLSGVAHLHVLLGTAQDQSWHGLNIALDHLGRQRLLAGRDQADIVLVQSMIPSGEAGKLSKGRFLARAEREFSERYYVAAGDEGSDTSWDISDMESLDAPHVPITINYDPRLAAFDDIAEIADALCAEPFLSLGERLAGRFHLEARHE